nr:hypothetical protein [Tanacetum cinerariifolium]
MRFESLSSWDLDKLTWEGRVKAEGTVPVCMCVHRNDWGEGIVFGREKWVMVLFSFSPSGDFEKFTLLVPGLWLLSFEGLGFDLLARLVPRL